LGGLCCKTLVETTRTLKRHLAGRRVVDAHGAGGVGLSAVGTGHLQPIAAPADGILARQRDVKALVEFRVPFELDRQQIDDVERGANDSDWQPAKDAAQKIAYVNGPYSVLLGADAYTALAETSDNGYPVLEHIKKLAKDEIIWTPAITGAFVLTTRGGDFALHIGQDVSIGYLSHTDSIVRLYLQETLTFLLLTSEAAVALAPADKRKS